ncbi:MAG: sodium-independent anion transporter, partial [Synergistaceae bacterium]|nr:sodium-independent anion transporter [Synergistaceae bacterium]
AIAAGVFFAVVAFVVKVASIDVTVSEIDPKRLNGRPNPHGHAQVVYVTGPMFFAAMGRFEEAIHNVNAEAVIFSMRGVPYIDTSGAQMLWEFCKSRKQQGVGVFFAALQPRVAEVMKRAGIPEIVGEGAFFSNALDAIEACSGFVDSIDEKSR